MIRLLESDDYQENSTGITINSRSGFSDKNLILDKIDGKPITEISSDVSTRFNPPIGVFGDDRKYTSVDMPYVIKVGTGAFRSSRNIESVKAPKAEVIGDAAFWGLNKLTSIDLPNARIIGKRAFENCKGLTTVNIPMAQEIGMGAFRNCENLTTVNVPENCRIDDKAFIGCPNLSIGKDREESISFWVASAFDTRTTWIAYGANIKYPDGSVEFSPATRKRIADKIGSKHFYEYVSGGSRTYQSYDALVKGIQNLGRYYNPNVDIVSEEDLIESAREGRYYTTQI